MLLVAVSPWLAWHAFALLLASAATWGVLRALALLLHLKVDETMLQFEDDPPVRLDRGDPWPQHPPTASGQRPPGVSAP